MSPIKAPKALPLPHSSKPHHLPATGLCLLLLAVGCTPSRPLPSHPHPIIIVDIDTLRAGHLGCYGYHRNTSPNIDAFADEAVLFEWAFSQAPNTPPSQASILTGLYPGTHGMVFDEDRVANSAVTLAEALRDGGFETAGFHDGGYLSNTFNMGQGFALYDDNKGGGLNRIGPKVFAWLEQNHEKDFLLFVHTYDTHTPYAPGPPYDEEFLEGVPAPSPGFEPTSEVMNSIRLSKYTEDPKQLPANDIEYAKAMYDGDILRVDTWFGTFMEQVRELGLDQRATIVVISDHGEEFQEHGSVLHEKLYATVTHVPMIIRLPNAAQTRRVSTVVETIDLMPTLLEITATSIPPQVQGNSLAPLLLGHQPDTPGIAFGESPFFGGRRHVTIGDLRLLLTTSNKRTELYRYQEDRMEQEDISKLCQNEVEALVAHIEDWENTVRVPLPKDDEPAQELDEMTLQQLRELGYIQ
ncbi:MAG: sulfatase [Thermoanaerobaculales bacterium]|nr:sulfatase [Thermoanaerobaculales bacterium]